MCPNAVDDASNHTQLRAFALTFLSAWTISPKHSACWLFTVQAFAGVLPLLRGLL